MAQKVNNISDTIKQIKNLTTVNDLSKFGKEFQIKLVNLLIKDRIFSLSIVPIIKDEYFTDPYLKMVFVMIREYIDTYHSLPAMDNIKIKLENIGENSKLYDNILHDIDNVSLEDRDFIIDNARKFCFSKHALAENDKVKIALENAEFEKAQSISFDSFKFSGLNQTRIYDLKKDFNRIYDDEKEHNPIPTPFKTFNDNMKGGPGKGNLVILVAPSNFGKSNLLIAFSRHANALNKKVVFFSFEIGGIDMLRRHIAGLTDIRQEDVKYHKEFIEARVKTPGLGEFILIEERATLARISTMKNHIQHLKSTGFYPDIIMVDALNQLKLPAGMKYEGDNQKFEYLCEELRDWANDEEVPIYSPFQTNRCLELKTLVDIENKGKMFIKDIKINDKILTHKGYKNVNEIYNQGKQYCYKIKTKNGKEIICSANHEFPISNNKLLSIESGLKIGCKLLIKK